MSTTTAVGVSPEEYLEFESQSELRHEYRDGEIVEVTGASREHVTIVGNLVRFLKEGLDHLDDAEAYSNDMRIKIPTRNKYVYPDVVVVSGRAEFEQAPVITLLNPTIVFEVLSESTEDYDRGDKRDDYYSLPSVTDYLLVSQQRERIERYVRQPDDSWLAESYESDDAVIEFDSVDCRLRLSDVYRKVFLDDDGE